MPTYLTNMKLHQLYQNKSKSQSHNSNTSTLSGGSSDVSPIWSCATDQQLSSSCSPHAYNKTLSCSQVPLRLVAKWGMRWARKTAKIHKERVLAFRHLSYCSGWIAASFPPPRLPLPVTCSNSTCVELVTASAGTSSLSTSTKPQHWSFNFVGNMHTEDGLILALSPHQLFRRIDILCY